MMPSSSDFVQGVMFSMSIVTFTLFTELPHLQAPTHDQILAAVTKLVYPTNTEKNKAYAAAKITKKSKF